MENVSIYTITAEIDLILGGYLERALLEGKRGEAGPLLSGELLSLAGDTLNTLKEANNAWKRSLPQIVKSQEALRLDTVDRR